MRFGVLGLGWAAKAFHAPALARAPNATLVGGADTSSERRTEWQAKTGTPAFETLEELVEREHPDVVTVATPPDSHAALCLRALELGTHVFCEKPFVGTLEEADRVLAAAERTGRRVAVNHEFREKPIFKALKAEIGSPEAGRLVFAQIWQLMDLAPWDERVAWRAAMPNRTLSEGGVHLVDLLLTLYDVRPTAVYARHSGGRDSSGGADAIHLVTLEFPDGRLAQITIDRLCKAGTRYVEVRADCEHASLRASIGGRASLQIGKKRAERTGLRLDLAPGGLAWLERGLRRRTLARNPRAAGMRATAALVEAVAAALADVREPPSSAREARDVLVVIDAAYRSAAEGRRVELSYGPTAIDALDRA